MRAGAGVNIYQTDQTEVYLRWSKDVLHSYLMLFRFLSPSLRWFSSSAAGRRRKKQGIWNKANGFESSLSYFIPIYQYCSHWPLVAVIIMFRPNGCVQHVCFGMLLWSDLHFLHGVGRPEGYSCVNSVTSQWQTQWRLPINLMTKNVMLF